jgi:hypothetical protein
MGLIAQVEHVGVPVLENCFFDCRAGRMLACPGIVSKAYEARFSGWSGTAAWAVAHLERRRRRREP